jgi:hypothetical protein
VIVARIRHPHVGERELLLGVRVVGRAAGQLHLLAVFLLERRDHVDQVDHVLLERRGQAEEHVDVVAGLRGDLGGRPRHHVGEPDVIHGDLDALLAAPLLGPRIEPLVVGRNEMAPLEDLELAGRARVADDDRGTGRGGGAEGHELATPDDELSSCLHMPPR